MSDDDEARVFAPFNLLRAKVGNKPGPNLDQIVASAEAALDDMKDEFDVWIGNDMQALRDALTALRQSMPADPEILERIKTLSHEIKGQGATYGYPLLTTVGDLLYVFIERNSEIAAKHLDLLDTHVDFMALVLGQKVHDEGDQQVRSILAGLRDAAKKAASG
jgi:chemotaxis protein histidine kinase CheA